VENKATSRTARTARVAAPGRAAPACLLACALLSAGPAPAAETAAVENTSGAIRLTMLTEEYPPFGFQREGEALGSSVDQVRRIMADIHAEYTIDVVPWARAIGTAETDPATCAFTTTLLPDRMDRFKWVEPLNLDVLMLVGRADGTAKPKTLAEAKAMTVAVHKADSGEVFAKAEGFPRLDSAPSLELSLKKLQAGRVDLIILTRKAFEELQANGQPLEAVLDVETTRSGIACNKAVPDSTIAAMQASLDRLIADGTQARLESHYGVARK
jgi:polar amino acid transport system substrate-binding protein